MLIIDVMHLFNSIKIADNECRAKRLARLDGKAAEFFNHAHIASLMAPRFMNDPGIERHAGKPRAVRTTIHTL